MYYYPSFEKLKSHKKCLPFVGIDDFAFLKGHRYGTIICDLSTHAPVALLPDRKPETDNHPSIQVVSRDGYQAFRQAIQENNIKSYTLISRKEHGFPKQYLVLSEMSANAVLVLDTITDKVYIVDFEGGKELLFKGELKERGHHFLIS